MLTPWRHRPRPGYAQGMDAMRLDGLLQLERSGWDSLREGRGGEFHGWLMTGDGVMVLDNGMVMDRRQVVASLDEAPAWDAFELDEARLIPVGTDSAALVYRAHATRSGPEDFRALMSSVYRLVDGSVKLALYQQTAVAH